MMDQEITKEQNIAVIETKLDQLLDAVHEIKNTMGATAIKISSIELEINTLKNKTESQQKEIDTLNKKNESTKAWLMGIVASIAGGIIIAIIKAVAGI